MGAFNKAAWLLVVVFLGACGGISAKQLNHFRAEQAREVEQITAALKSATERIKVQGERLELVGPKIMSNAPRLVPALDQARQTQDRNQAGLASATPQVSAYEARVAKVTRKSSQEQLEGAFQDLKVQRSRLDAELGALEPGIEAMETDLRKFETTALHKETEASTPQLLPNLDLE
mgnify:CR=1 FL=1